MGAGFGLRMRGASVPPECPSMKFEGKIPMKMERGRLAVTASQNGRLME